MTSVRGHICVRRKAKDGAEGAAGKSVRNSVWESGKQYYAGDTPVDGVYPLDIVSDKAMAIGTSGVNFYMCVKTHVSPNTSNLTNTTYWKKLNTLQPVVTYLILAELIKASFIDVDDLVANSALVQTLIANTTFTETLGADTAFIQTLLATAAFIENLSVQHLATYNPSNTQESLTIENNEIKLNDSNGDLRVHIHADALSAAALATTETLRANLSYITFNAINASQNISTRNLFTFISKSASDTLRAAASWTLQFGLSGTFTSNAPTQTITANYWGLRLKIGSTVLWEKTSSAFGISMSPGGTLSVSQSMTMDCTELQTISQGYHVLIAEAFVNINGAYLSYIDRASGYVSAGQKTFYLVHAGATDQYTEIGSDGLQVIRSGTEYLRVHKSGSAMEMEAMNGNYGIQLTSAGLKKTSNGGGSWESL